MREDYFEERSKLEKQNFDLKMRIYYLEGNMLFLLLLCSKDLQFSILK